MKKISAPVNSNCSKVDAIFDFLRSHPPSDAALNSYSISFFSSKSFEERIGQHFQKMADKYHAIRNQAKQLANIADEQSLLFVINQLQHSLEECKNRRDTLLTRYSNIANIFALVGLCLVVYGKAVNTQLFANIGLLTCILGGIILIVNLIAIIERLNSQIHLLSDYIQLLKQAQS